MALNYNRNTNRQIVNHTINPRWTTGKAYKSHLNSPVIITRADGTTEVEKPLKSDEINKINKIPKKRKRNKRKAKFVNVDRQYAVKDREKSRKEYLARQRAQKPKQIAPTPVVVSKVKPAVRKSGIPESLKSTTEFKAVRQPNPAWLARKAEQEAANQQREKKLLPWEGKYD